MSIFETVRLIFGIAQLYWAWRGYVAAKRLIRSVRRRRLIISAVLVIYFLFFFFNAFYARENSPVHMTPGDAYVRGPFLWWGAASTVAFLLMIPFVAVRGIIAVVQRLMNAPVPESKGNIEAPPRREFLERTANIMAAAPFVAGAYGMLYGRLNLETTAPVIYLDALPRQFEGFRT
jgi:hypothetical protein